MMNSVWILILAIEAIEACILVFIWQRVIAMGNADGDGGKILRCAQNDRGVVAQNDKGGRAQNDRRESAQNDRRESAQNDKGGRAQNDKGRNTDPIDNERERNEMIEKIVAHNTANYPYNQIKVEKDEK